MVGVGLVEGEANAVSLWVARGVAVSVWAPVGLRLPVQVALTEDSDGDAVSVSGRVGGRLGVGRVGEWEPVWVPDSGDALLVMVHVGVQVGLDEKEALPGVTVERDSDRVGL